MVSWLGFILRIGWLDRDGNSFTAKELHEVLPHEARIGSVDDNSHSNLISIASYAFARPNATIRKCAMFRMCCDNFRSSQNQGKSRGYRTRAAPAYPLDFNALVWLYHKVLTLT